MAVRSKLLAIRATVLGSSPTVYTTPTGHRTIVKGLVAWNGNAAYNILQFDMINTSGPQGSVIFELGATGALGAAKVETMFWVIPENWWITATVSHSTVYWQLSGAELLL